MGGRALLTALTWPYGVAVRLRTALYACGVLSSRKLPCRVISIGNLTVGGTGKTPVVIWTVQRLQARGWRVGVLSRGYKRRRGAEFLLVSDGTALLAGPAEAGDEPHLIARRCPGAVVAVGADRYRLGQWVLARQALDCLVLDDGFQHLALQRDVNVLLVDASARDDVRALLPVGRLREPMAAASRASVILLTRADQADDAASTIAAVRAGAGSKMPILPVRFMAEGFIDLHTGGRFPPAWATGRTATLFSGIAQPASFRTQAERLGLAVKDDLRFPDHHPYSAEDLEAVRARARRAGAEWLVTTEKDADKVRPWLKPEDRAAALRIGTEIMEGQEQLERLLGDHASR